MLSNADVQWGLGCDGASKAAVHYSAVQNSAALMAMHSLAELGAQLAGLHVSPHVFHWHPAWTCTAAQTDSTTSHHITSHGHITSH